MHPFGPTSIVSGANSILKFPMLLKFASSNASIKLITTDIKMFNLKGNLDLYFSKKGNALIAGFMEGFFRDAEKSFE